MCISEFAAFANVYNSNFHVADTTSRKVRRHPTCLVQFVPFSALRRGGVWVSGARNKAHGMYIKISYILMRWCADSNDFCRSCTFVHM